jgi:protein-S-isoprenylcysteine O-methyltransferase Ste14
MKKPPRLAGIMINSGLKEEGSTGARLEQNSSRQQGRKFAKAISMKKFTHIPLLLFVLSVVFSSCELIGDIFQAGLVVGIIVVVVILALIIWLLRKIF